MLRLTFAKPTNRAFGIREMICRRLLPSVCFLLALAAAPGGAAEPPNLLLDDWQIELVASAPDLVTPINCRFDNRGRLLVVESHTHFPPDDYDGPEADRIYLFDDSDGDGRLDRQRLFYQGGTATMGLEVLDDDSLIVARRDAVLRLRDTTGDDEVDSVETLLQLESPAVYPHNGLGGLAVLADGDLVVGQGENLGQPYELVGSDGTRQSGQGEGGNVFRFRPDGSQLRRVATGFWNPFGLHVDASERLWAVCNDPDARPPCRLLHVVPAADFGFQFRFGRAGTHPLQAWDGEQPGTLPMASGTGEAPCAVVSHGRWLWVTSWGDNRIERYTLQPNGASWQGRLEVVAQGGAMFRPVDMAVAADGSIYITDWVDRSYPVHGKGRLWRLQPKSSSAFDGRPAAPSEAEQRARRLASDPEVPLAELLTALDDDDPFIRQAGIAGLVGDGEPPGLDVADLASPRRWVGWLTALRWIELTKPQAFDGQLRTEWLDRALAQRSDEVCRAAARWAAETSQQRFLPAIRELLRRDEISDQLFRSAVASIAYLETGSAARGPRDPAVDRLLIEVAEDIQQPPRLRRLAIDMLGGDGQTPSDDQLAEWLGQPPQAAIAAAVVGLLVDRREASAELLVALASDEDLDAQVRADAVALLSRDAARHAAMLQRLAAPTVDAVVRGEARRVLRRQSDPPGTKRPKASDIDGWMRLVGQGGDPRAGWRVFVRTTCVNCHSYGGRGAAVGPDLATLASQGDRRKIVESILQPSKEVGPLYVAWQILTDDGRALTGLKLDEGSGRIAKFIGADGDRFDVPLQQIVSQQPTGRSIMPNDLDQTMSVSELRDLVALLADE